MTTLLVCLVFVAIAGSSFESDPAGAALRISAAALAGMFLYFAKDSIKGTSIGKWAMGITVRDEQQPGSTPPFGRLFLRNLLLVIWPVELIILITNEDKKRLGDQVAKTIVMNHPAKPGKLPRIALLLAIGVTFFAVIVFGVIHLLKNSDAYQQAIREISTNEQVIAETGGIKGYGILPTGSVSVVNGEGQAFFNITARGRQKDLEVSIQLEKPRNGSWRATSIEY